MRKHTLFFQILEILVVLVEAIMINCSLLLLTKPLLLFVVVWCISLVQNFQFTCLEVQQIRQQLYAIAL